MILTAQQLHLFAKQALDAAKLRAGATSPNPSVGAIAWDSKGDVLQVATHQGAGHPHAEALLLTNLNKKNIINKVAGVFVTLEPCNHHGRTGPCTEALLQSGITTVYFGSKDPNPVVTGGGEAALKKSGCTVKPLYQEECNSFYAPYRKWVKENKPWFTLKKAINKMGNLQTMIPPSGKKTFSQQNSLKLAHAYRRRADAILTGSGTILADNPQFTVRLLPDHFPPRTQKQLLIVADRRKRVPTEWYAEAIARGFEVYPWKAPLEEIAPFLASKNCQEVLIETGPTLTGVLEKMQFWDTRLTILHSEETAQDEILFEHKSPCWEWSIEDLADWRS